MPVITFKGADDDDDDGVVRGEQATIQTIIVSAIAMMDFDSLNMGLIVMI
jgi:hypothetical protein